MKNTDLFDNFFKWANSMIIPNSTIESGKSEPELENIAWMRVNSPHTISGIKLWASGEYYLEVLSMQNEEPELARFGSLTGECKFDGEFSDFVQEISRIERAA